MVSVYGVQPDAIQEALGDHGYLIRRRRMWIEVSAPRRGSASAMDATAVFGVCVARFGRDRVASGSMDPATCVVSECRAGGLTIATVESCTGGLLGAEITSVPGSSQVYWGGAITYANEAKTRLLEVPQPIIDAYGAVSEEVVRRMAEGARHRWGVDLAVAVSGVAGPSGGTVAKPVGTVWISVAAAAATVADTYRFTGDRQAVRERAVVEALLLMRSACRRSGSG